jgi:hypothetical protein
MSRTAALFVVLASLPLAASCAAPRPSEIPVRPDSIIAVKSTRLTSAQPALTRFAHHSWIDVKNGDEDRWKRYEIRSRASGMEVRPIDAAAARADVRWDREVRLLEVLTGPDAAAAIPLLDRAAKGYEDLRPEDYRAWPGPNSNTFVARLGRRIPGLAFELDHNAVGKDYASILALGGTTTGTGLAVDSPVLGLALGLREGVELHLLQLTFGLSLFPPALKLPVLPRIGFGP